ncbi:MAG: hypothetical protein MZV65_19175 [Chromatiales bacterium]|nr:hypothetical protein [Chromatiales bacterium]
MATACRAPATCWPGAPRSTASSWRSSVPPERAYIGAETALALAGEVLSVVRERPRQPILFLVDTLGQRLNRRDELLGVNGYLAHLAQALELARRHGHRIVGLIYGEAVSGGFLAGGMMADITGALPDSTVRVMNLEAMARVMKIPLERLEALSRSSPVFAPGVDNFFRLGGVTALWSGELRTALAKALAEPAATDVRRELGRERGGRTHAAGVARRVRGRD